MVQKQTYSIVAPLPNLAPLPPMMIDIYASKPLSPVGHYSLQLNIHCLDIWIQDVFEMCGPNEPPINGAPIPSNIMCYSGGSCPVIPDYVGNNVTYLTPVRGAVNSLNPTGSPSLLSADFASGVLHVQAILVNQSLWIGTFNTKTYETWMNSLGGFLNPQNSAPYYPYLLSVELVGFASGGSTTFTAGELTKKFTTLNSANATSSQGFSVINGAQAAYPISVINPNPNAKGVVYLSGETAESSNMSDMITQFTVNGQSTTIVSTPK